MLLRNNKSNNFLCDFLSKNKYPFLDIFFSWQWWPWSSKRPNKNKVSTKLHFICFIKFQTRILCVTLFLSAFDTQQSQQQATTASRVPRPIRRPWAPSRPSPCPTSCRRCPASPSAATPSSPASSKCSRSPTASSWTWSAARSVMFPNKRIYVFLFDKLYYYLN